MPLLEAMAADVPVLAYAAAAVPDTLGGAGVQFSPKDLEYAAELLGVLTFDDDVRAAVIAGQRRRLRGLRRRAESAGERALASGMHRTRLAACRDRGSHREDLPSSSSATGPRSSAAPSTTAA